MTPDVPTQTYRMPFGFSVHLSFSNGAMAARWEPYEPGPIRSRRALRKLKEAYGAARAEFMQTVATVIGGNVLILDPNSDGFGSLTAEIVMPAKKH